MIAAEFIFRFGKARGKAAEVLERHVEKPQKFGKARGKAAEVTWEQQKPQKVWD